MSINLFPNSVCSHDNFREEDKKEFYLEHTFETSLRGFSKLFLEKDSKFLDTFHRKQFEVIESKTKFTKGDGLETFWGRDKENSVKLPDSPFCCFSVRFIFQLTDERDIQKLIDLGTETSKKIAFSSDFRWCVSQTPLFSKKINIH